MRLHTRWLAVVLPGTMLALLVLAGTGAAEGPPPPGLGIRLLDAPTSRADDPRARSYVVDQVKPGTRFTRRVQISNGDQAAMDVILYAAAGSVDKGSFAVADRGVPGEIPDWVTMAPASAHLGPGARVTVTATFAVPAGAPSGEVYGGLVVERPATSAGPGVGVNLRAAVRVYLSVGPGGEPRSDFRVDTLAGARDATGRPMVIAQVHNTGGRALDMSGTLRLSDGPAGLSAGPFAARVGTTLGLGQTEPVTVPLDRALPAGPWKATLELQSGRLKRTATGTISFPAAAGTSQRPVKATDVPLYKDENTVRLLAVTLIGVVSLALLVVGLLAFLRRRRQEEPAPAG